MIKEFLESLKIKDIVFFVLIIVLFSMVLKKNKKEGFSTPYVYNALDFKTKVETALGDSLIAIINLGNFAGQLISAADQLDLSGIDLKVKSLEVKNDLTVQKNCTINEKITVKGGGDFNADNAAITDAQYHFEDYEKAGRLRVGAAWGVAGIFSEDGDLMIASKAGKTIKLQNNTLSSLNSISNKVKTSNLNTTIKNYLLNRNFKLMSGAGMNSYIVWSNYMSGTHGERFLAARHKNHTSGDPIKFVEFA